jgi:predicted NAD/FAD-binding protein
LESGRYAEATLAGFIADRGYSDEFVRHFLIPLAAAVWSTPPGDVRAFPAEYFLRFLLNHGIIGLGPALVWRTVTGGSREYVRRMTATFPGRMSVSTPVLGVMREADGAAIMLAGGTRRRFDKVVLACHADDALRLLDDAGHEERRALGMFAYTSNRAVLHTDASMLPKRRAARASWNYVTDDCRARGRPLGMTYHLNRLQALREPVDYCVSLNATGIRPDRMLKEMNYDHPQYTFDTLAAQHAVERLQGERHTLFAGAHLGYGFHEDGVASGASVAAMLGVEQ